MILNTNNSLTITIMSKMKDKAIDQLNQVKQRPILFSTPMVKAILEGRKTMTRRITGLEIINEDPNDWQFEWADFSLKLPWRFTQLSTVNKKSLKDRTFNQEEIKCQYGKIGDILWVRETWSEPILYDGFEQNYYYKADNIQRSDIKSRHIGDKWKPSIHMPKSACRIYLEILNIRVERLHDITEAAAINEGIKEGVELEDTKHELTYYQYVFGGNRYQSAVKAFRMLWIKINGSESWDLNPFVWVIEFKRIEKPNNF